LAWDGVVQRDIGIVNFKYLSQGDKTLVTNVERYHGPAFELLLFTLELGLNALFSREAYIDTQVLYLMRHLVTFFMFFASVVLFHLLCRHRFQSWKIGLLGSLFLICSPRIFAHAFYNSKDLPFMSMFIISVYTLIKFLDKKTLLRAFFHALACGFLLGIRVMGILVPCLTIFLVIIELISERVSLRIKIRKWIPYTLVYFILFVLFAMLFWPILMEGPVFHFIEGFKDNARHIWTEDILKVLYFGDYIKCTNVPWHYTLVWIGMTTPPLYLVLFLIGFVVSVAFIIKNLTGFPLKDWIKQDFIFLTWFLLPLLAVMILHSVLYDGYRHMFFIYPALILIAIRGFVFLIEIIQKKGGRRFQDTAAIIICIIVISSVTSTLLFMVRYHPYQNVYFNRFAGKNTATIKKKFELDYWGLSYRKALEYILKNDSEEEIPVYVAQLAGRFTRDIIKQSDRRRLKYVLNPEEAKYFVSNYRWHMEEYPYDDEYFSIKIRGEKIIVVYKFS
jgi:hypothetical protein